jgi:chitinase
MSSKTMQYFSMRCLLLLLLLQTVVVVVVVIASNDDNKDDNDYVFPCYYVYQPELLKPESVPPLDLCTHLIIMGCALEYENETRVSVPQKPQNCTNVLIKLAALRQINPSLKVIISMGTNANAMHAIVQNDKSMNDYVESAIDVVTYFDYDGIDFDWEYPCDGDDRFRFTRLLAMFRTAIDKRQLFGMTMSAAIGAGLETMQKCFDLESLGLYLDYINLMCYDYNTIYNTRTAYASPLYARPDEVGEERTLNSNFSVNYLLEHKVPAKKIVLGLNAGGHTYQLAAPALEHDFHARVLGVGYGQGWSLYPQLCELANTPGGKSVYDDIAQVLYAYYDDQWTNTGDVRSATAKSKWAKKMGLAGVFTWCLNWDDIYNVCGHNETFPIHRAIRRALFDDN